MSSASIQRQVSPPSPVSGQTISGAPIKRQNELQGEGKIEFSKLLNSSNLQAQRERAAEGTKDLSSARNDEEFFSMLEKKTSQKRAPKSTMDKDDFLKLFVTQLQNQDPLNPKENSELAAQLAQFNGLEQMLNVNKTLEKMNQAQSQKRTIDLVDYIGKEVLTNRSQFRVDAQKNSPLEFEIEKEVGQAVAELRDSTGAIVHTQELGVLKPGKNSVQLETSGKQGSKVPTGMYTLSILGVDGDGKETNVDIKTRTKITGINFQGGGDKLYSENGELSMDDIIGIGNINSFGTPKNENSKVGLVPEIPKEVSKVSSSDTVKADQEKSTASESDKQVSASAQDIVKSKVPEPKITNS